MSNATLALEYATPVAEPLVVSCCQLLVVRDERCISYFFSTEAAREKAAQRFEGFGYDTEFYPATCWDAKKNCWLEPASVAVVHWSDDDAVGAHAA